MKTKQLPKGWREVELGDICEVLTGFAFKSNLFNEEEKGKPIIRIRDLAKGKSKTYYSGKFEEKYLVKRGDFLIGMDGEFKVFEWKSENALLNQRVCKLILNKDLVIPKYIYYMISKKLKEIEDKTPFVTVKHISNKQILSIKFILPPTSIQNSIVQILEKAETLKQKREDADKLTKEYLQSVF
ncbi:MAG: restriction endonuclease subunit S, partial [Candidatus Pacearchaeota archaeon]|nr:restriction endonuclease subunit S [Candidatus Pacearchaeota archaeon]